jgi:predicted permease
MAARDRMACGEPADAATFAARRQFGNVGLVTEATREVWGWGLLDRLGQDLRSAVRSLKRSPGFAVIAVVALGVGLGLSTTMFAVLDAVVHPYVAYRDPDALFRINWWFGRRSPMTSVELYRYLRDETRSFEAVVPVAFDGLVGEAGGQAEEVAILRVSPRYFAALGVRPRLGRALTYADEGAVVVSSGLWRRFFNGRRSLDGATVELGSQVYNVVGVLPRGAVASAALLLLPASVEAGGADAAIHVRPTVRLRQGVTREQADAELRSLARLLTDRFGARDAPFGFELRPVVRRHADLQDIHRAMVGSALAVLLIACVNLAHLMLARGLAKRRELALRMALGASRAAVVRQMFAECVLVTFGGVVVGALVAVWGADVLQNRMPPEVSWVGLVQPQLSWRVFALAVLAAAASAVVFGLLPAIRVAFALNVNEPLKEDSGTTTGPQRQRYSPLVVAEVGLALVLMMGGGLLLRTVYQLQREETVPGARTLFNAVVATRPADSAIALRPQQLLDAVAAVEGVREAAYLTSRGAAGLAITAEMTQDTPRTITMRVYPVVSISYVHVLGLPILRGRDFLPGDEAGTGVAVIDPIAAQRLYPNQDPIGRMIKLGAPASRASWVPIVGVVRSPHVLEADGRNAPEPTVYVVQPLVRGNGRLLIRTTTRDPRTVVRLQSALRSLPGASWTGVRPFDYDREGELVSRDFLARVFVAMGVVALGLAALGLYGVLAYAVSRRMREFAVRVALGAEPRALLRMVLHDGLVMLLAGIGAGAFVALAAARLLDAVLIVVLPSDVVSLVLSEAVLITVGLAAAVVPARRAARANPLEILRAV